MRAPAIAAVDRAAPIVLTRRYDQARITLPPAFDLTASTATLARDDSATLSWQPGSSLMTWDHDDPTACLVTVQLSRIVAGTVDPGFGTDLATGITLRYVRLSLRR